MSHRCLHCSKPFGMVRRGVDLTLGSVKVRVWDSKFCNDTCESDYRKARQQEQRVLQFLQWLHAQPP